MKRLRKISAAIAMLVIVNALIYGFFAFLNWELFWMPNVGGLARFIYFFLAVPTSISIVGVVIEEMEG